MVEKRAYGSLTNAGQEETLCQSFLLFKGKRDFVLSSEQPELISHSFALMDLVAEDIC
jgi:hypothetical protein